MFQLAIARSMLMFLYRINVKKIKLANKHSFKITLSNNKTEKEGIGYLTDIDNRFIYPDKETRKKMLKLLNVSQKYNRTFDLIFIEKVSYEKGEILIDNLLDITLIELKTTKKSLPNNPIGFFFGATENEFDLAELLGDQYKFCFICLHPECTSYKLLTLSELNDIIKTKRIQYQINL
jgi:hypothetical protein